MDAHGTTLFTSFFMRLLIGLAVSSTLLLAAVSAKKSARFDPSTEGPTDDHAIAL